MKIRNKMHVDLLLKEEIENMGDNHMMTSIETPMKPDAFEKSDTEKMKNIEFHFTKIMEELGLDLSDDSLKGTPHRVAKMFVKEIFLGLDPKNKPKMSVFDNKFDYDKVLIEKNITFSSFCEHHFLPFTGKAHIGYISSGKVIGLSKLNRIVDYYSRRPQVQERLTVQILNDLMEVLDTEDVIVVMSAAHMCVSTRGIKDHASTTTTIQYEGKFKNNETRKEFLKLLDLE